MILSLTVLFQVQRLYVIEYDGKMTKIVSM